MTERVWQWTLRPPQLSRAAARGKASLVPRRRAAPLKSYTKDVTAAPICPPMGFLSLIHI